MAKTQVAVAELVRGIRLEQRERFKGRWVRYHGRFIMNAIGSEIDLKATGRPADLNPAVPVLIFRMPDNPDEEIAPSSVTTL